MNYWLMKSEPDVYSWDDLARDKKATWDGVRNYQARNNLKAMKKGDLVFIYHSNIGKEIVGIAKIVKENQFDGRGINLKKHLVPLWHFFLTSSAISLYVNFDTIILHHITHNEEAVGYYTTALKMV